MAKTRYEIRAGWSLEEEWVIRTLFYSRARFIIRIRCMRVVEQGLTRNQLPVAKTLYSVWSQSEIDGGGASNSYSYSV